MFAQAAQMQAEMNGEMDPGERRNLVLRMAALVPGGQSKSDVLGGKAPDAKKNKKPAKPAKEKKQTNGATRLGGGEWLTLSRNRRRSSRRPSSRLPARRLLQNRSLGRETKPLFQFQGDENFVDSDEEEAWPFPRLCRIKTLQTSCPEAFIC